MTTTEPTDPMSAAAAAAVASAGSGGGAAKGSPKVAAGAKFLSEGDDHSSLEDSEMSCYSSVDAAESKVITARTPESLPPTSPPTDNEIAATAHATTAMARAPS